MYSFLFLFSLNNSISSILQAYLFCSLFFICSAVTAAGGQSEPGTVFLLNIFCFFFFLLPTSTHPQLQQPHPRLRRPSICHLESVVLVSFSLIAPSWTLLISSSAGIVRGSASSYGGIQLPPIPGPGFLDHPLDRTLEFLNSTIQTIYRSTLEFPPFSISPARSNSDVGFVSRASEPTPSLSLHGSQFLLLVVLLPVNASIISLFWQSSDHAPSYPRPYLADFLSS